MNNSTPSPGQVRTLLCVSVARELWTISPPRLTAPPHHPASPPRHTTLAVKWEEKQEAQT
ncbi:hypothetical protein E2C01_036627 [Portunus trituberculatus]|uniref:Uncharacterized protein n=1 Tax=Portunus trituberculatus TaxID=210409 RepID=A0A5B7F964_PORTR|nr:hypothetical protein [Portunus trituberculatus]